MPLHHVHFQEWLRDTACRCQRVVPTYMSDERGWGGTASAAACSGDMLLAFPAEMLMDAKAAHRSATLGPLLGTVAARGETVVQGMPRALTASEPPEKARKFQSAVVKDSWAIILLLLHELGKGDKSFWFRYIDLLPKHFDNALHFSDGQAALLAGTRLADQLLPAVNCDLAALGNVFEMMQTRDPSAFPQRLCNLQSLRWAHSVFWSRALVVPLDSDGSPNALNQALCPYLDLLNHCPRSAHRLSACETPATHDVPPSRTATVALIAGGRVTADSEVVINYGRKSNEQLLL